MAARVSRCMNAGLLAGLVALSATQPAVLGQKPNPSVSLSGQTTGASRHPFGDDTDPLQSPLPNNIGKLQNSERQNKIVSDTQRLIFLTSQLKAELAVSTSDTLTPEMVRQAAEIEKLARNVKNRMRN